MQMSRYFFEWTNFNREDKSQPFIRGSKIQMEARATTAIGKMLWRCPDGAG